MTTPTTTTPSVYRDRVLPSPAERRLAAQLSRQDSEITALWEGLRAAQLGSSSVNGTIPMRDEFGILTGIIGQQADGTNGLSLINAAPPPRPNTPDLVPFPAGLAVAWNGEFPSGARPLNFLNVECYLGTSATFIPGPSNFVGTLTEAGSLPIAPLAYVPHYAVLIATNVAEDAAKRGTGARDTASPVSLISAPATPAKVVADEVLAGIVTSVGLADDAVTKAKLAAGSVDATKVEPGSITSPLIAASTIQGINIAAETIYADLIATDAVDARIIRALAVTADALAANSVTAGAIAAGVVTASKLAANLVLASRIIAGDLAGARVEMHPTDGLQAFRTDGTTRTFWINAATGEAYFRGEIETASIGSRIVINPGGTLPDEMRFYQGSVYAYLNAESAPGSTAALVGRSQRVNNVIGAFGCYPTEAFLAIQNTSDSLAAVSVLNGQLNIWANGNVSVDVRSTTGRVDFTHAASASGMRLEYRKSGSNNEPQLFCPSRNIALTWANFGLYVGDGVGNPRDIVANNVVASSSRAAKKNERDPVLSKATSARNALGRINVKQFNYTHEWAEGEEPPPPPAPVRRTRPKTDRAGHVVVDPVTNEPVEEEVLVEVVPPRQVKPHFGVMAEDLLSVLPEVVVLNDSLEGGLGIAWNDVVGYLLWVNREQEEELRALRRDVNGGGRVPPADAPAPGTEGPAGSFLERGGTLYYRNSAGVERRVA